MQTGSAECVLILTIHHIVADAWSMSVLFRDLNEIYSALANDGRHSLAELPIQYADYAVWQRQPPDTGALDASLAYWRSQLAALPTLQLPTDRPRATVMSHRGRTLHFAICGELAARLLRFARARALTPFTVLLAALGVVMQRNCAQDDIVIGVPVAGRDRIELENLIGFLVNMLVLRLDLGREPSFLELAARVQRTLQEGLAHQSVPFERLVEELRPARDLSRNPLFQVSAQYLVAPLELERSRASGATVLDVQRGASNFDLSFDFWPEGEGLAGRVDYSTDLFDESTVKRWIAQLQHVIAQALDEPERSIEALDLLSAEERQRLLVTSTGKVTAYPRHSTLAQRFAEIVKHHSESIAIAGHGVSWSYAELDRRSAAFASHLKLLGAKTGGFIGVALPRGPVQVAAVLGIIRLGCAYVGLDPRWPTARRRHCLHTAQVRLVVCDEQDAALFADPGITAVCGRDVLETPTEAAPFAEVSPLAPAYVAFTSGSSGEPKAVVVPHRAVLRLVCDNPDIVVQPQDRMLLYAPLAFDASTLEIWATMLNGACLCVAPAGTLGLEELAAFLDEGHISMAWLTAGLFHQLAATHPDSLARIRRLFSGGDVLGCDAIRRVLTRGDKHCVVNGYGPHREHHVHLLVRDALAGRGPFVGSHRPSLCEWIRARARFSRSPGARGHQRRTTRRR
jgi:non-ribosomal peptide synthetase component F